ncbi:MAG TPA: hypothetical protein DIS54_00830 [Candidatus Veblenbacteria bacterium]|nr:hypothetical protein [Candidatus Veblenbacteria bacterium]
MFSVLAGLLFIAAFVPYIRSILKKETKPAKASWIIWASLDTITLTGMFFKEAVNGQILGAIFGAWIVVVLTLKYGIPGWTKLDKFCLGGAILGIILWQIFSDPTFGIMTSLSVVFLGSIPTFMSAWKYPSRENKLAWIIFWVSCIFALIAIPRWTLADAAQPITFFAIETIMMYILFVHPRMLANSKIKIKQKGK